ncbi:MAG TPA: YcnI family protein [Ramlibacter sp.]|nr:YcnI family protein [Ramlibacter sp.]
MELQKISGASALRLLMAVLVLASPRAFAHVNLEYGVAPAGSSYKATFKVGHGCDKSPTRQVSVDIPAGVKNAKPMPKPGWTLEVQPARITWTARTAADMLPDAHYDEFVLVARMPEQPGTLHWPVRQVCESGRHDWIEVPRPGQNPADLKSPAPALEILPGSGAGGHKH